MRPIFLNHMFNFNPGNSAAATPTNLNLPEVKGQVTPKFEGSSQPAKKARVAVKAKQQLQKQQHPKKASFQKQNGISKGTDSGLSTVSSDTKSQAFPKVQDSSQRAQEAEVIRGPKVTKKLKQKSATSLSSKKVAFRKQNGPPKGTDTEVPVLSLSKTQATINPEDCDQLLRNTKRPEKLKQQLPEQPSKRAAFQKQNGTPKGPETSTVSPLGSSQPPPAKRRKSQSRSSSHPVLY